MSVNIDVTIFTKEEFLRKVAELNKFTEEQKELHRRLVEECFVLSPDGNSIAILNDEYHEDCNMYYTYMHLFEEIFKSEKHGIYDDLPKASSDDKETYDKYEIYEKLTGQDWPTD